jgi:hypothetical protein
MLRHVSVCSGLYFEFPSSVRKYIGGRVMYKRDATISEVGVFTKKNKCKSRTRCELALYGIFYGIAHTIKIGTAINSSSGLNILMVNAEGRLIEPEVERFASTQMLGDNQRLAHKNQLSNSNKRLDTYENSTALIFILLLEYQTKLAIEKTDTMVRQLKQIPFEEFIVAFEQKDVDEVRSAKKVELDSMYLHQDLKRRLLNSFIKYDCVGGEYVPGDESQNLLINRLIEILTSNVPGDKVDLKYEYWYVAAYDDGHNLIDSLRYEKAGFVNRAFLVNNRNSIYTSRVVKCYEEFIKVDSENDLERFNIQENKIRVDNLSSKEFMILLTCLGGRNRTTPFLSDQTVDLEIDLEKCHFYGNKNASSDLATYAAANTTLNFSSKEILNVLNKYVTLHRVYDDALAAQKIALTYICQPDCDTLEGHYWFNMPIDTVLPKFKVFRGIHAYFLVGDPVRLKRESMEFWDNYKLNLDLMFNAGLVETSLWYQAEYLSYINSLDDERAQYVITEPVFIRKDRTTQVAACISSITGLSEVANLFPHTGSLFSCENTTIFEELVLKVDKIESVEKLTLMNNVIIKDDESGIWIKTLVPVSPSGDVLVIGLSGSLLENTPLHHFFTVTKVRPHQVRRRWLTYVTYLQLWCWAVITRFCGFDAFYTLGSDQVRANVLVCFAANVIQVAKPPIHDITSFRFYRYVLEDIIVRWRQLAELPYHVMQFDETRTLEWCLGEVRLLERPDWRSLEAKEIRTINRLSVSTFIDFSTNQQYVSRVSAKFIDIENGLQTNKFYLGETVTEEVPVMVEPKDPLAGVEATDKELANEGAQDE